MTNKNSYIDLSETKAWNVAKDYADEKILKWLKLADYYEIIAFSGVPEMLNEFDLDEQTKALMKLKALRWLDKCLLMVVNNTIHLVKTKEKPKLEKFREALEKISKIIFIIDENSKIKKRNSIIYKIDEEKFNYVYELLIRIKADINEPLNKSGLIMSYEEESDPEKIKQEMIRRIVEEG